MTVTNPNQVWDLTGLRQYDSGAEVFRASANITAGQLVVLDTVTSATVPTVRPTATNSTETLVLGVALNSAGAGREVYVRCRGFARVQVAGTVTAGTRATRSGSSAGRATNAGASPAEGTTFGVFVSGDLGDGTAIVKVER